MRALPYAQAAAAVATVRIDAQGKETAEQFGQLRERMAKLEGLLEGLRETITGNAPRRGRTAVRATA